jgi:type I site-specific restriction-modification system R (restriction) subunit
MRQEIIKEFKLFNSKKDPREVVRMFSDIFVELEDQGGWLSYVSDNHQLVNIESENPIKVEKDNIYIEFKSKLDSTHEQREADNQNKLYLYIKSNLNILIDRFENSSKCKITKANGSISLVAKNSPTRTTMLGEIPTDVKIIDFKQKLFQNRIKFDELENILFDGYEISII